MKHKKTKKFLSLAIIMGLTPIVLGSSFFVTINPNSYNVIEGGGNEGGGNEGGGNEGGGTNPPIEPEKPLIPSKLWLEFIQDHGEHLNIKKLDEFNSNNASINLHSKSLTNESLPQENLGLESPFNLYFQHNKLTNFEFLNGLKHVRGNLYLYVNDITNLKGLNKLEKVDDDFRLTNLNMTTINELISLKSVGSLRLYNNPKLNNLTGLSNLEKGRVILDDYSKYKYKPNMNSPFCKNLVRGNITVERYGNSAIQYNARDLCTNFNSSWLDKIQSYKEHLNIKNMNEFNSNNASINLHSKSLTNESLPKENLGLESPFNLYFQHNKLTNFEFLNGLKHVRGNLYLYVNDITNLKGLNELEKVDDDFRLTNLNMTTINELMSLKSVGALRLYNNPNLNNLIGLSNLEKGKVMIDDYSKYKYKPNMNSPFCKNLVRGNITVERYGNTAIQYNARDLCTNFNSSWLDKIQSYGEHLNIKNMNEFNSNNASINLHSKSLTNESLPKENLGLESPFNLYFQHNKLTNFEFLNGLKHVRGNLYLYRNDITNLKGLNELEKVDDDFRLINLNMTTINELMSLKSVGTLRLYNNPKLNNLIGLSNLEKGKVIIDDYSKYKYKPNMNSAFCKNLSNKNITVERYGNTAIQYTTKELCD